jgi:hypothetical protein
MKPPKKQIRKMMNAAKVEIKNYNTSNFFYYPASPISFNATER